MVLEKDFRRVVATGKENSAFNMRPFCQLGLDTCVRVLPLPIALMVELIQSAGRRGNACKSLGEEVFKNSVA